MASRDEAATAFARVLMERIRSDRYPSTTHMSILEESIPHELVEDYYGILLEKVMNDQWPSIPMLRRIQRVQQYL